MDGVLSRSGSGFVGVLTDGDGVAGFGLSVSPAFVPQLKVTATKSNAAARRALMSTTFATYQARVGFRRSVRVDT